MQELERMITETRKWRLFHREQYRRGVRGAGIEALACDIRETALVQARDAVLSEPHSRVV